MTFPKIGSPDRPFLDAQGLARLCTLGPFVTLTQPLKRNGAPRRMLDDIGSPIARSYGPGADHVHAQGYGVATYRSAAVLRYLERKGWIGHGLTAGVATEAPKSLHSPSVVFEESDVD